MPLGRKSKFIFNIKCEWCATLLAIKNCFFFIFCNIPIQENILYISDSGSVTAFRSWLIWGAYYNNSVRDEISKWPFLPSYIFSTTSNLLIVGIRMLKLETEMAKNCSLIGWLWALLCECTEFKWLSCKILKCRLCRCCSTSFK